MPLNTARYLMKKTLRSKTHSYTSSKTTYDLINRLQTFTNTGLRRMNISKALQSLLLGLDV